MPHALLPHPIIVLETLPPDADAAKSSSTIGREIHDLAIHNTHHLAIVKLLLQASGIETQQDFGKAPSTIVYEQSCAPSP